MRVVLLAAVAGLLVSGPGRAATVCAPVMPVCGREVVVFPSYTPEGLRVGSVVASAPRAPHLDISTATGRPLTVIYNDPSRQPGVVDPDLVLMSLPHVRPSRTRAVYPVGY